MAESQEWTILKESLYDDPSQLSQLLRQRAGGQFSIHSVDSTAHYEDSVDASPTLTEGLPRPQRAAAALSSPPTRAASRRVRFDPRHATPSLRRHNSAPVSTGELLTGKEDARRIHQTFNGTMDAPGDTQVDPDIFKEFTSGLMGSNSLAGFPPGPVVPAPEEGSSESAGDRTVASSQEQRTGIASPVTINDDAETQFRARYAETSPLKLLETPAAYTHRKRGSQSQVLSSAARTNTTPGTVLSASAFFSFGDTLDGNGMSLTQAFNATQAKTSPAAGNPSDDLVFQRPSPNFAHPRHSSPAAVASSPIKAHNRKELMTDPILRSSSEPHPEYESIKHSQERRSRERAREVNHRIDRQDSWEEPTGIGKLRAKQKAKERLDHEAARSLAGVSAPVPSPRRPRKRGLLSVRATTTSPKKNTRTGRASYYGPYDDAGADAPCESSSQPSIKLVGDDDSPGELSHALFDRRSTPAVPIKGTGSEQPVQVPHTSPHPIHTLSGHASHNPSQPDTSPLQPQPDSQPQALVSQPLPKSLSRLRSSRETEVVMDSQPDPTSTSGASQPAQLRFPSSPSTNQYSINQTTMLPKSVLTSSPISSAVPMPPKSSSQERDMAKGKEDTTEGAEEGVPSSPPLATHDDDITYDEHAYDEHSEDEREELEAQDNEGDVVMASEDDEDDLPTPQDHSRTDAESDSECDTEDEEGAQIIRNDDEVPETNEQQHEENVLICSNHSENGQEGSANTSNAPPRTKRQSTVPETDTLEETQPSIFPDAANAKHLEDSEATAQATAQTTAKGVTDDQIDQGRNNNNEHSDIAKEQQPTSPSTKEIDSTMEAVTAPSSADTKGRSLLDIANQPDTQRSVDIGDLDLPQLVIDDNVDDPLDAMIAQSSPFRPNKKRRTTYSAKKAFRSPIKDTDPLSDQLTSSPCMGVSHTPGWSPPTTQDREAQGAQAASRARKEAGITQTAMLKSETRFKKNQPQTPRRGALKTVNKALLSKSPGKTPSQAMPEGQTAEQTTPTRSYERRNADVDMRDADHLDAENEPVQEPNILSVKHTSASASYDFVEIPTGERIVPNRVFAFWPGNGYHPATCVGRVDSHRLRVRYDDGTINTLEAIQLRALDLRPADQVKIDIPGMKKLPYVVVGFKNKIDLENLTVEFPMTNCHGYATVVLEEKQRDSFPADAKKRIDVPVANIYLTMQLWARLKDRTFQYKPDASPGCSSSRAGTPRTVESAVPVSTALRRSTAGPSLLRDSTARASSVASSARSSGNIFLNMAFAITSTNKGVNKDDLGKLIASYGGLVVDEGFHELFDTDLCDEPVSSADSVNTSSASMHNLQLKEENKNLRFAALIAQSHSRSPKFLQALSLNIPCLHIRWVHDSLAAGHALPFAKYLLPAGTSTFLDPAGVVRSRDMPTYDPTAEETTFAQVVKERNLLFRDESVLIVSEENGQEPYIFLTHAMGATEVGQCYDIEEAKESIETGAWDWVFVDGKPDALADAAAQIFATGNGKTVRKKTTKKRKRDSEVAKPEVLIRTGFMGEKKVRVVCGEFVVQSLILGALVEA